MQKNHCWFPALRVEDGSQSAVLCLSIWTDTRLIIRIWLVCSAESRKVVLISTEWNIWSGVAGGKSRIVRTIDSSIGDAIWRSLALGRHRRQLSIAIISQTSEGEDVDCLLRFVYRYVYMIRIQMEHKVEWRLQMARPLNKTWRRKTMTERWTTT